MTDDMVKTEVTGWHAMSVLNGPPGDQINAVTHTLNRFLDAFDAAYRTAGNP